jgi:lysozyme
MNRFFISVIAILAPIFVLAACAGYVPRDPEPTDFPVHGIDISRWQGDIDWFSARRGGVSFAFIKATEGGDHVDPRFLDNFDAAARAGVPRSAYHFYYWCRPAMEQVAWFRDNVPNDPNALPPVLDVEWNNESRTCRRRPPREEVVREMRIWLEEVERLYGKRPIIYTSVDFHADNLVGEFDEYPIWVRSVAGYPVRKYDGRRWTLWQYAGDGRVPGVNGEVDRNVFAGSPEDWQRWLNGEITHNEIARY